MQKLSVIALAVLTAALSVVAGAFARTDRAAAPAVSPKACMAKATIGFEGPLTGPAGFLGQEQISWAAFAVLNFNKTFHSKIKLDQQDTQLDPAVGLTVATKHVTNRSVLAIIGPSTSGAAEATGALFAKNHLAAISPSATKVDLTSGKFPTFFRIVPNDSVQGPTDVKFMTKMLHVKHVFVVDSQEPYGVGLADSVQNLLRARGVKVDRDSTDPSKETDFSPIVSKVGSDVQIVFTPWQEATAAQTVSQQLLQQGKRAIVFGTDGTYDPGHFRPLNGYVSTFAPDIHGIAADKALIKAYTRYSHKTFGTFGPPAYMATWIAATAIKKACANGKATRAEVTADVAKTKQKTIYNTTIRFTAKHDLVSPKFFLFKITNGKYRYLPNA